MSMRYPGGLIAPTPINQQYPSGVWTGAQSAPYQAGNVWAYDSSFKNTTLLLHGDGATRSFTQDASTNNFQLTLAGDTKPNNLTPFITNGYWSNFFSATGSYLSVPYSSDFNLTGDFTIEFWMNPTNLPTSTGSAAQSFCRVFSFGTYNAANSFGLEINSNDSGNIRKLISWYNGTSYNLSSNNAVTTNTWQHIALVRSGTTITCYVNGTSTGTITGASAAVNTSQSFYIATLQSFEANSSAQYAGYLSNFSILKGTAKYTGNFTPTTSPLSINATNQTLLTCYGNRFYDANTTTTAKTITATGSPSVTMQQPFTAPSGTSLFGSGYFDGTGDYLTAPNNSAFDFGSGSFTLEAMIFPLTTTPSSTIFGKRASGAVYGPFNFGFAGTLNPGYLTSFDGSNWGINISSSVACIANAWNHIAVTRNGSTFTIWVNGVSGATASNASAVMTNTTAVSIGATAADGTSPFNGYIADARIVKGTAVYTTTFTPPTAPLTPVSGTSLLTLQTNGPENNNGFLDSSLNSFPVTRNGNTTQGAFSPYGANWSNYFGGTSYITLSSAPIAATGAFTFECWVYVTGTATSQTIYGQYTGADAGRFNMFWNDVANKFTMSIATTSYDSASTYTANAWYHIAWVRDGSNNLSLYVNGVRDFTTSGISTSLYTGNPIIAARAAGAVPYTGYISNLRITNTAVYSGTSFTVPATPLTNISGTTLLTCQSNRFVDNETTPLTFTITGSPSVQRFNPFVPTQQNSPNVIGGSGYFDGSGDYLSTTASTVTGGDFTIEAWVYLTSTSASAHLFSFGTNEPNRFSIYRDNANNKWSLAVVNGGSYTVTAATSTAIANAWNHVAWVRSGSTNYLCVNGVREASNTASLNSGTSRYIAGNFGGVLEPITGYISDFRVSTSALYTGTTYTVPTAPFSAGAGTNMLLNYTNAAIFDNSGMNNLETVGNAQIDTSVVKYGTSSMYFDGSGDYLTAYRNFSIAASENFTVEGWFYLTAAQANYRMIVSDGTKYFTVNSGGMEIQFGGSSGTIANATYAFSQNVWYHIAVVRNNNVVAIYVNGIALTMSQASQSAAFLDTGTLLYVSRYTSGTDYPWFGYIDDLRITKGVARYVTNFTPPVARMPNQ